MGVAPGSSPAPRPAMRVIAAGAMTLTLMPCAAPAVARLRVSPMTPAFAVAYERLSGSPNMPDERRHDDAAVALLDHVRPRGAGRVERAADVHGEVLARLSASASGKPAHRMMPALLTRTSMRPNCSTAASTSACAPAAVATSLVSAIASPPAATISAGDGRRRAGVGAVALHRAAEVVDHDARAPLGEQPRVGPADPASRAGDDRDAPLEAVRSMLPQPSSASCTDQSL